MDVIERLKLDVREGRVDVDRLIDVVVASQRQLETTQRQLEVTQHQLEAARQRIEELEKKLGSPASPPASGTSGTAKVEQAYSMRAEEKRQRERGRDNKQKLSRRGRRGRLNSADKIKLAERTEVCYPADVPRDDCWLSHTRAVWRLEAGRAVLVAYQIYRGPGNRYGQIVGVLGRGEFGLEIIVQIAYLVYVIGLSFDKVCTLLQFMQNLPLGKTQVDALLKRLSRHWQHEFDVLCTLLANSLVVHADETSWSINSVWAFLSEKARLLFFGVHKDGDTIKQILDPETFAGLVISDDYAVYANFTQAQKCWAHLLRKAFKLTLLEPANEEYRAFADGLLTIYRKACRVQRDGRLCDAGRERKVKALDDELLELCVGMWSLDLPPLAPGPENDYRLLVNEVMRLMLDQELFTFVTTAPAVKPNGQSEPVSGTNNESERKLRTEAQARDTGRTNKSTAGARRQTIVVSVLESLRLYLPKYTLNAVIEEIQRWWKTGQSCFSRLLQTLGLSAPTESILDKLLPVPTG